RDFGLFMIDLAASAPAWAPDIAPQVMRLMPREWQQAFVEYPNVVMAFVSMGLAAAIIGAFWILRGMLPASAVARVALRAPGLKRGKDHRGLVLIAEIDGAGHGLRQEMKEAIEDNFGLFAFQQDVQVDLFPISLPTVASNAHSERRRKVAVEAVDALERSAAD